MNQKTIVAALAIAVVIGGVIYFGQYKYSPQNAPVNNPAQTPNPQSSNKVAIKNFAFSPSVLNVSKGDTVTWTNEDAVPHHISGSGFQSGDLSNGESYSFTFSASGTYDYICSIHPSMKGEIVVK